MDIISSLCNGNIYLNQQQKQKQQKLKKQAQTLIHTLTNILNVNVENHGCSLEHKCWLSFMS